MAQGRVRGNSQESVGRIQARDVAGSTLWQWGLQEGAGF